MKINTYYSKWLAIIISLLLITCAIYNRSLIFKDDTNIDKWVDQFFLLITIFTILTVIHVTIKKSGEIVVPFKFFLLFVFFMQYGAYPEIMVPVLISALIEIMILKYFFRVIVACSIMTGIFFINLKIAWSKEWVDKFIPFKTAAFYIELVILLLLLIYILRKWEELSRARHQEVERLNNSINLLTSANLDFQKYIFFIQQETIENERSRISREIHDSLGYTLTNINMMMEAAVRLMKTDHDKLLTLLLRTRHQTETGLLDMRKAMRELRVIGSEVPKGARGVKYLTATFQNATGVEVNVEFGNLTLAFPEQIENIIFRFIQEGMTNAFRHGKATQISIYFLIDSSGILNMTIMDNGSGGTEITEGIGLTGMIERLSEHSGSLNFYHSPIGFVLKAYIPIKEYLNG